MKNKVAGTISAVSRRTTDGRPMPTAGYNDPTPQASTLAWTPEKGLPMSEHKVTVEWKRETDGFSYESYHRDHVWVFEGGIRVPASAAPAYRGNPANVNPEEALVAALSSCHMLTFLAIAARKQFVVDHYSDNAVGFLEKNEKGKLAMTRVILRPRVTFGGQTRPTPEQITSLHERAHRECFIANSVTTEVTVEAD